MKDRKLDESWTSWLRDNLHRQCDPHELVTILLRNRFSLHAIRESMGERFPAGFTLPGDIPRENWREPGTVLAAQHGAGKRSMDEAWKCWLAENLDRQCDPEELLGILLQNRFSVDSIRDAMGEKFPSESDVLAEVGRERAGELDYRAISETRLTRTAAAPGRLHKVDTDKLQLYVLDEFMTAAECDSMLEIINQSLRPSTVTIDSGDRYFRTSRTSDLSLLKDALIAMIDERIARTLGIRVEYSEGIQAQRYDVAQEFKAHTDYFEPGTAEYVEHATASGNRTWTFMVYLNEGMQGGGTKFPAIDRVFYPKKGQAVIWNNLYPDGSPNPDTLHAGTPVTQGHKIIITKWFREKGSGPMFYEDE